MDFDRDNKNYDDFDDEPRRNIYDDLNELLDSNDKSQASSSVANSPTKAKNKQAKGKKMNINIDQIKE